MTRASKAATVLAAMRRYELRDRMGRPKQTRHPFQPALWMPYDNSSADDAQLDYAIAANVRLRDAPPRSEQ